MSATSRFRSWADAVFGADLRSLGLFRVGLAAVLLWDLFDRSHSVAAHYTETGTVPVGLLSLVTQGARFSIHAHLSGSLAAQWTLLALTFAAGVALLVGFRTRVAALAAWALLGSLQVRNPLVSWEGADRLLCILLLFSVLAPVGARFSLDARRSAARARDASAWLCTPATALFVLQIFALYFITGIAKTGEAWADGSALQYALRMDFFGSPLGRAALPWEGALSIMSHATIVLERVAPFLLFVPVGTWLVRLGLFGAFAGFHLGILALMSVGCFSPLSLVLWTAILPSQVWDALAAVRARRGEGAPARSADEPVAERGARLATPLVLEAAAAALCGFLVLTCAAKGTGFALGRPVGLGPIAPLAHVLRLDQNWAMFSPEPSRFDLWPAMTGTLAGGGRVDAFRGGPPTLRQPESVPDYFPNFKWRIHLYWLIDHSWRQQSPHLLWEPLADHLCRAWNARHEGDERMTRVDVVLQIEPIDPHGQPGPVRPWPVVRGRACPAR